MHAIYGIESADDEDTMIQQLTPVSKFYKIFLLACYSCRIGI
jgi:hypothetical protein